MSQNYQTDYAERERRREAYQQKLSDNEKKHLEPRSIDPVFNESAWYSRRANQHRGFQTLE